MLFAMFMLLLPTALSAQDLPVRVMISGSPQQPVAGSTWVLTMLVDHYEPNDVVVLAPHFTGSLIMEQLVKGPRYINIYELWTALEYRFVLNSPGTITFDSFTVITPYGRTTTAPFDIWVQGPPSEQAGVPLYRLVWEGVPSGLSIGESAVVSLRVSGRNPAAVPPEAGVPALPVPAGHILESLPLTGGERSAGMVLKLRLIPLQAGPLVFESRRISSSSSGTSPQDAAAVFEIPALRITVTAKGSPPVGGAPPAGGAPDGAALLPVFPEPSAGDDPASPFPRLEAAAAVHPGLFRKYQNHCETTYRAAEDLWESRRFAEALAMLRRAERNHPAGNLFAGIRREAERALGFAATNDEKRGFLTRLFNRSTRTAILRETAARRIPHEAGEVIRLFKEGQPVLVPRRDSGRNAWLMITTNDGNRVSGWVPEADIIFY